jgi:hypothetical protein
MPLTDYGEKLLLDWILGGAAASTAPGRWISLATGSPNQAGASDGLFTPRGTVTFAAANSPQGSATNLNIISGTLVAVAGVSSGTVFGWNLYDRSQGGTRLAYGTTSSASGVRTTGSTVAFLAGTLKITLA